MTLLPALSHRTACLLQSLLIVLSLTLSGCAAEKPAQMPATPKTVSDYFDLRIGDRTVRLQFALLPLEQQRGLMERRDLGANDGMVFIYRRPQAVSFWMRNTPTPLDIGFFDGSGILMEVYPLHPYDETGVKSRSDAIKYAVEMPQGWYSRNGIKAGALLDLAGVAEAVRARGFDPAQFKIRP